MWCLIYAALSAHYNHLERLGQITDDELEARLLHLQKSSLSQLSEAYVTLFDKPVPSLED